MPSPGSWRRSPSVPVPTSKPASFSDRRRPPPCWCCSSGFGLPPFDPVEPEPVLELRSLRFGEPAECLEVSVTELARALDLDGGFFLDSDRSLDRGPRDRGPGDLVGALRRGPPIWPERGNARSGRPHCDRRGVVWWHVRPWRRRTVDSSLRHGASSLAGCQATNPASSACGHRASLARPPGHALPSSAPDSDGSVPGRAASRRDLRGPGGRVRPHGLRIAGVSPTPRDACIARGPRGRARLPGLPRVRHDLRFAPQSLRRTVSAFGARLRRRVLAHGFARARCAPRPGSTRRIVWCASEALPSFGRVPVTA